MDVCLTGYPSSGSRYLGGPSCNPLTPHTWLGVSHQLKKGGIEKPPPPVLRQWSLMPSKPELGGKSQGQVGPNCLYRGKLCLPEPHPDPVPSEIPGDPDQSPRWPTQAGRHRVHQTDNASPSMVLCAGFPLRTEGRNHLRCLLPAGWVWCPWNNSSPPAHTGGSGLSL